MSEFTGIELQRALDLMSGLSKEFSFSTNQTHLYNMLVTSCPVVDISGNPYIDKETIKNFMLNFQHALKTGDSSALRMERGLKVKNIVDIIEFAESRDYMNQAGHIRPVIKYELNRLFHEEGKYYVEAVLGGATNVGKNYFCEIAMPYMVYCLSCYKSPQVEFGLAPGSPIFFIVQSATMTLAKRVAFGTMQARMRLSPYFQKFFPYDQKIKSELKFPNDISIVPISGAETSALGMNVYGGLEDEANFMARTTNSMHTKYTDDTEFDQAQRSYNIMIKRIKGRFMQRGKVPGKLLLVSSANYEGDFISRKIDEAKTDDTIFVMYYTQWDAFRDEEGHLPRKRYSGDLFLVEKGNDVKSPRIIDSIEDAINEEDVIEIPIEHKPEFEKDIVQSLKDLAGVGAKIQHPFIMKRELIKQAADGHVLLCEGHQLFTSESLCLNNLVDMEDSEPDWDLVVNQTYLDNMLNPDTVFATHIDLAKNNDACGLAVSHIIEYQHKDKVTIYDKSIGDFTEIEDVMVPIYMVDGALQITNPPGDEIDFELVKRLVLYLRGKLNLKYASLDIFNSVMMIQAFRRAKIKSGLLSVDSDMAPYNEVKSALKDNRIYIPNSGILQKELRELEVDNVKGKVDHPIQGCFTGDTEVVTVDNQGVFKVLSFDELCILYKSGKTYNTLTYDPKDCLEIRPAPIINPRITKYVDTLIELEFETGETVKCTPEHLFLLTNGEYKEAQYLTSEDEIFS